MTHRIMSGHLAPLNLNNAENVDACDADVWMWCELKPITQTVTSVVTVRENKWTKYI